MCTLYLCHVYSHGHVLLKFSCDHGASNIASCSCKARRVEGEATVSWGEVTGETSRCLWKSFDHPISMTLSFCWDGYLWTRYLFQSMKLVGSALGMVRTTLKNPTCLHVWKYGGSTSYFMYAAKEPGKKNNEMRSCSLKVEKRLHLQKHISPTTCLLRPFFFG